MGGKSSKPTGQSQENSSSGTSYVAKVGDTVIAESDQCQTVEGNLYFPPDSIKSEYFTKTEHTTGCPWKGTAHYYTIKVDDKEIKDSAWYYPEPKSAANNIKGYVAFYKAKGITVE